MRGFTGITAAALSNAGIKVETKTFFDTLRVKPTDAAAVLERALANEINLRDFGDGTIGITLDETVEPRDVTDILAAFGIDDADLATLANDVAELPDHVARKGEILTHPVFHAYRSETELLRYVTRLQAKDLSLTTSMIPLGSCTMKLNATAEMIPVTWPEFGAIHPFAPADQAEGYAS